MLKKYSLSLMIIVIVCFLFPTTLKAQLLSPDLSKKIEDSAYATGKDSFTVSDPGVVIATVIKAFLSLLGIIFIVLVLIAGYNWMTAQGDEAKVTSSKKTLTRAVIGLLIIIAAYSLTHFVFKSLDNISGTGSGSGGNATGSQ